MGFLEDTADIAADELLESVEESPYCYGFRRDASVL